MKTGTKCRQIVDTLSDEIAAGRYRAPLPFPSAEQIVRRFKVAYLTAVKALDELKRQGLVYSVQGAGTRRDSFRRRNSHCCARPPRRNRVRWP